MCVCVYIYVYIYIYICLCMASHVMLVAKNLPAMKETRVLSLGQEDPLVERMAINSSILVLAWEIPWTEGYGRL